METEVIGRALPEIATSCTVKTGVQSHSLQAPKRRAGLKVFVACGPPFDSRPELREQGGVNPGHSGLCCKDWKRLLG